MKLKFIYTVKLTGVTESHENSESIQTILTEKSFFGLKAVIRFISWFFNNINVFKVFGFNEKTLDEYFANQSCLSKLTKNSYFISSCGNYVEGFEELPVEQIRRACPALNRYWGINVEIIKTEVLSDTWKQPIEFNWTAFP